MFKKEIQVINKTGLHARPAAEFVGLANKFKSTIQISKVGKPMKVNAKSMVFVLSLAIKQFETITIEATGDDETDAVNALVELVGSGFGE